MTNFILDLSRIKADDAQEYARKLLIEFLRQYAAHIGVTQEQLTELTHIKQANISRFFSGSVSPTLDTYLKIAGALKLRIKIKQQ